MVRNQPKPALKEPKTCLKTPKKNLYVYAARLAYLGPLLFKRLALKTKAQPLRLEPLTTTV
ncbi:hypothetical protein HanOQP8_Chr15g0556151 [Helianthus annuus]|nr:hypothetical protein HanOQP8_Chr15g0556151 [Helianthus annuus]